MFSMLYDSLLQLISSYVSEIEEAVLQNVTLTEPKQERFGHFTTNLAMILAKQRRQNPLVIAEDLQKYCLAKHKDWFAKISVVKPGFVNFTCSHDFLYDDLKTIHQEKMAFGKSKPTNNALYNLELVSANPTGPLHIGHVRNGVVGDVYGRVLANNGYRVTREYYTNDAGKQINYLALTLFHYYLHACGKKTTLGINCYKADCYELPGAAIYQQVGAKWKDVAYDDEEIKDEKVRRWFCQFGVRYFLNLIQTSLQQMHIQIDYYISEKEMFAQKKVAELRATYEDKGYLYKKDGAWWLASSLFGDDKDRVFQKSDQTYSYIAADLASHAQKLERTKADLLINFWGADHHGYIKRMQAGLQMLGYSPAVLEIVLIQMVRLVQNKVEVKISKRKGTAVWANDLLDLMSVGELRYWMCARNPSTHLEIDLDLLQQKSMNNAYFYNQYAFARMNQIFKLADQQKMQLSEKHDLLQTIEENRLMLKMSQYHKMLATVVAKRSPDLLCDYFFALSKLFHSYYNKHRIVNNSNQKLTAQRLGFLKALKYLYQHGFNLLQVELLEQM